VFRNKSCLYAVHSLHHDRRHRSGAVRMELLAPVSGLSHIGSPFIAGQLWPLCVLSLETPRRYLSSYETGPDNLPCRLWCQGSGFSIGPSY